MPGSVFAALAASGARAIIAGRDFAWDVAGDTWNYRGVGQYAHLPPSALPGAIQYRNAATAIAALEALALPQRLDRELIAHALARVNLAGRFQILPGPVEWILDVTHNEPAARVLARHLAARPIAGRTFAVASILRDKDVAGIGRALAAQIDCWILCSLGGARGSTAAELASRLTAVIPGTAQLAMSVQDGCVLAREQARPGDRVLVFGSFPAVGSALEWLGLY
jgi:dihydrofolate synthase/folylpolyglutamate synthase